MTAGDPDGLFAAAVQAHQGGRIGEAEDAYRAILSAHPHYFPALTNLGLIELQCGHGAEALELLSRSLAAQPDQPPALANRGALLCHLGRYQEALSDLDRAIALRPGDPASHSNRGFALNQLKRYTEALASCDRALSLNPNYAEALNNRGHALAGLGRQAEAVASFERSVALRPDDAEAHNNLGMMLFSLGRGEEALARFDRAIALSPDYAEAHNNRGFALSHMKRYAEALASCDRALARRPDFPEAFNNRGTAMEGLGRFEEALASYERAITLRPDYAEAYNNRGTALFAIGRATEALASFGRAITLRPDLIEALANRGDTLGGLGRYEEAIADFNRAQAIDAERPGLRGSRVHVRMHLCDWAGIEEDWARVLEEVDQGRSTSTPFQVLTIPSSPAQQRRAAEQFAAAQFPARAAPLGPARRHGPDRIRVGYFSADLREHAQAHLLAELIERHDRERFEVFAYAYGPDVRDDMRRRLEQAFDRFTDIRARSDEAAAALAREHGIDIALDLTGYTGHSRTGVFSHRAAPVQVNYLGYPGTSGAPFVDYLIADPVVIPRDHFSHYSEKIVWLPHCYQPNDSTRPISDRSFSRRELGLPERGFVFCCFNGSYKLTPDVFEVWMRLLREIEGSVLWLLDSNATSSENLRREAARHAVVPERLVFAPKMDLAGHLARHRHADLFLDTFWVGAHTTASDALWAGLPLLTCPGEAFPSRVAASLLSAIGLPELIAPSREAYEALALSLAADPGKLDALRRQLVGNRTTRPLFDTAAFARGIETAYVRMVERSRAGLPPDHLVVPAA